MARMNERAQDPISAVRRRRPAPAGGDIELAVWRARVDEQLASIRDDIADLRSRLGALFIVVAAAALGQVVMRLLTGR